VVEEGLKEVGEEEGAEEGREGGGGGEGGAVCPLHVRVV